MESWKPIKHTQISDVTDAHTSYAHAHTHTRRFHGMATHRLRQDLGHCLDFCVLFPTFFFLSFSPRVCLALREGETGQPSSAKVCVRIPVVRLAPTAQHSSRTHKHLVGRRKSSDDGARHRLNQVIGRRRIQGNAEEASPRHFCDVVSLFVFFRFCVLPLYQMASDENQRKLRRTRQSRQEFGPSSNNGSQTCANMISFSAEKVLVVSVNIEFSSRREVQTTTLGTTQTHDNVRRY